jgi:hypothetical protein
MQRRRTVRASFLLLAGLAALLGGSAQAQDAAPTGDTLFGSYDLEARGTGVQTRYEIEGLLPGGSPILDLTIPETLARFGSGPTGYGLASLAYPGGLIVNLGSLIAQSGAGADAAAAIPDYPVKSEAFFPSGPLEAQSQAVGDQQVHTNNLGVDALGTFPGIDGDPVISTKAVRSASRSSIEDGKAVSRTRVVLTGVNLLGGVINIDSLVTDLVAVHDGSAGTTSGGTTATGVRFLGLAASLTDKGLVLADAPPATGPGAPLGSVLNGVLSQLAPLTQPVQDLIKGVLDDAVPSLNGVLAGAGIDLKLLNGAPVVVDSGASAFRSSGLSITLKYTGKEQTQLRELIESIPPDLRPNVGPLPNPIAFLTENHITGLTLGQGSVSALARPPFDTSDLGGDFGVGGDLPSFDGGDLGSPDFSTPLPDLPPGTTAPGDLGDQIASLASGAIPAALLLVVLAVGACMSILTTRLADNVLAPVSTACPSGLDKPPAPPREP